MTKALIRSLTTRQLIELSNKWLCTIANNPKAFGKASERAKVALKAKNVR